MCYNKGTSKDTYTGGNETMITPIITEDIRIQVFNLNNTGRNYIVQAYVQDMEESDMYTVEVQEAGKDYREENYIYYTDSSGNLTGEDADQVLNTPILKSIHEILFNKSEQGLIKGF